MGFCRKILISSYKGGVGKSTVTANLAMALALWGKKTLAVDLDLSMRCLDIIMGFEDRIVYDIADVASGRVPYERALIQDFRSENLFFIAAPYRCSEGELCDTAGFAAVFDTIAEREQFDFILFDAPSDASMSLPLAAAAADEALIIASHQPASIRAAERASMTLTDYGITNKRLIINSFDTGTKNRDNLSIIQIIDKTCIQLIGVLPYDQRMSDMQLKGSLISECSGTNIATAYKNISSRLCGKNIPLLYGFSGVNRVKLING